MKVITAEELKKIEQSAINDYGISELVLMENAGVEVSRIVKCQITAVENKKIIIFAGKGNNGGDAFVVARHLANQGAKIKVFILGEISEISASATVNLNILRKMNIDITTLIHERDYDKLKIAIAFADCIVDGLIGTGFNGSLKAEAEKTINLINNSGKVVISIDIPSGVSADNGKISATAVRATKTVTFSVPKLGLILYPGTSYVGELFVADIGIPRKLLELPSLKSSIFNIDDIKAFLPIRAMEAYKGSCGRVLVIAGSLGMTGAATLATAATLRAGAGMVTVGIGESLNEQLAVRLTETLTLPLAQNENGSLNEECIHEIRNNILEKKIDAVVVGPGLGRQHETQKIITELITEIDKPLVIDADGLVAISEQNISFENKKYKPVLTPHLGEFSRLIGLSIEEIQEDIIFFSKQAAKDLNCILVLKGPRTIVASPQEDIYINTNANEGMATAGAGDVLSGIIGSFIAQGLESFEAAVVGVFVHGLAGDIVACNEGKIGMIASDIVSAIPKAIAKIQTKRLE